MNDSSLPPGVTAAFDDWLYGRIPGGAKASDAISDVQMMTMRAMFHAGAYCMLRLLLETKEQNLEAALAKTRNQQTRSNP